MKKSFVVPATLLCFSLSGLGLAQFPATTPIEIPEYFKELTPVVSPVPTRDPSAPVTTIGYGSGPVYSTPTTTSSLGKKGKRRQAKIAITPTPRVQAAGKAK